MKTRILIVEDDRSVHQLLAAAMASDDYELVRTQNAHEALRRSLDEHFDLILLDVNVTGMDACKALDWFSVLHPFRPVAMLALEKPLDQTRLLQTVTQVLNELHSAPRSQLAVTRDWGAYAE